MPTQLLVNVLAVGPLGAGASVTLPHGLASNDVSVAPTLIFPDRITPIAVSAVTATTVTFTTAAVTDASNRMPIGPVSMIALVPPASTIDWPGLRVSSTRCDCGRSTNDEASAGTSVANAAGLNAAPDNDAALAC
jgi:hypothetical protein